MSQHGDSNAQPNNFYSPAQLPSPATAGQSHQYNYPPPDPQSNSPSTSNVPPPPLSLPPIRSIDGMTQNQHQQQQQQAQQGAQAPMASAIPPAMTQYYGPGQAFPPSSDPNTSQRWPIPPDGRIMSGGRHKKEIKRRTKTGCLTCRKRRIKCDEAHPACRNCQKSKRQCLGYDPIFKSQPGPTAIQPAVGGAPPLQPGSINASPYPPPPQGYTLAGPPGYGQAGTNSENSTAEPYDISSTLDPALAGVHSAKMQDSKADAVTGSPHLQGTPEQLAHRAKQTKVEDLVCLRGYSPPGPAPPAQFNADMERVWSAIYAPAIDKFLETKWFVARGLTHLMENTKLCNQFASLLTRFVLYPDPHHPINYPQHLITQSMEAVVIWAMMSICRPVARIKSESGGDDDPDLKEGVDDAAKRHEILEALMTGEYLDMQTKPQETKKEINGTPLDHQLKERERSFWTLVRKFLTLRDDEASAAKEIDDTLLSCRKLLDSRENRDVVYSIMIARHIGARMAEFPDNLQQPEGNDEGDTKHKLRKAKDFIESQNDRGTNQVVQRICGMAVRSWALKR